MDIILPLMTSAFSGRDNHFHLLLACLFQHGIAIIGTICKEFVRGQIRKHFSGGYRIVYVARREKYTQRISKSVNNCMNFACQSASCTSDCLSDSAPFCAGSGADAPGQRSHQ